MWSSVWWPGNIGQFVHRRVESRMQKKKLWLHQFHFGFFVCRCLQVAPSPYTQNINIVRMRSIINNKKKNSFAFELASFALFDCHSCDGGRLGLQWLLQPTTARFRFVVPLLNANTGGGFFDLSPFTLRETVSRSGSWKASNVFLEHYYCTTASLVKVTWAAGMLHHSVHSIANVFFIIFFSISHNWINQQTNKLMTSIDKNKIKIKFAPGWARTTNLSVNSRTR